MENRFKQEEDAYKYLDPYGKAFVNGMHWVLNSLQNLLTGGDKSELASIIGDKIMDEISDSDDKDRADKLKAYDAISSDIYRHIAPILLGQVQDEISNTVENFCDEEEYWDRKSEVDKKYAGIELSPDMTLVDDEGYTYGVIRAVSKDGDGVICTVVLEEPEDETTEIVLSEADVKTFALLEPYPMSVTYTKGKKISHYRYGGDVEEPYGEETTEEEDRGEDNDGEE